MTVAYEPEDILRFVSRIRAEDKENPILIDKFLSGTELEVDVIFDGSDILIPGIMEHVERAGVHSGDSIAIYPSFDLPDSVLADVIDCTKKLAVAVGAKGLLNIQYLIHNNQLYVIEVNPRASRTVPYISKVTGLPVVDIAVRVMMGETLRSLGYESGLYNIPPYYAVKVPVFSYEKLSDADFSLGPQMKSTGEVLGIGKSMNEALFKGLIAAGYHLPGYGETRGIFVTVNDQDKFEIVNLVKKFQDIGSFVYATSGTAAVLEGLGGNIAVVDKLASSTDILTLIESGKIGYVIYTANGRTQEVEDFISIQQCALRHHIACFSFIDTANVLADILQSRFNESNTELVDLNNMRSERQKLSFSKMQGTSDDYIFFENFNDSVAAPESLALTLSDRRTGIGGTGIVLIERSDIADAKMRIFNGDGSEGTMAGNSIRSVGKYLYDNNIVKKEEMTIETKSGVRTLFLYPTGGEIATVSVDMGKAVFSPKKIPVLLEGERVVNRPVIIANEVYNITCLSVGNPHCVVFVDRVDDVGVSSVGPLFEHDAMFPERVNAEFVRVVNRRMLKMRVWERGNGETYACGTGACAAVVAAVENGYCDKGKDITVKLKGGDLIVNYTDERVLLTGDANLVYTGTVTI